MSAATDRAAAASRREDRLILATGRDSSGTKVSSSVVSGVVNAVNTRAATSRKI